MTLARPRGAFAPKNIVARLNFNHLYMVGDINCDFTRDTYHVRLIREFFQEIIFDSLWTEYPVDFTHSYDDQNGVTSTSILDHIVALKRGKEQVVCTGVLHLVENMSDHEPIYAVIKSDYYEDKKCYDNEVDIKSKPKWKDATADQELEYNDLLFRELVSLEFPDAIRCRDVHCQDKKH